jgi:hypothetical protein
VHAALPLLVLYFPATQPEHTPPSGPVNPALQVQAAMAVLETGAFAFEGHTEQVDEVFAPTAAEYVPVLQSVHATLPLIFLYLPATQAEQFPPGPVYP